MTLIKKMSYCSIYQQENHQWREAGLSLLYQHIQHCTFTRRMWDATVPPKGTERSAFECSGMLAIWSRVEPAHFPHGWGDTADEEN